MSALAKLSKKMKKKIPFGKYPKTQVKEQKSRVMYTLTSSDMGLLEEVFIKRLEQNLHSSISGLMSEAIQLLHKQNI